MVINESCGKILSACDLASEAEKVKQSLNNIGEEMLRRADLGFDLRDVDKLKVSMSKQGAICFHDGKRVYLMDEKYNLLFAYESRSLVWGCTISENAKYVVFQLFSNEARDDDSEATVLLDVESRTVLARRKLQTGCIAKSVFIDEKKQEIAIQVSDDTVIRHDFHLNPCLHAYYMLPNTSPYTQNHLVNQWLDDVEKGSRKWADVEIDILDLLEILKRNLKMSHYQLAATYRRLGGLYVEIGHMPDAITAYETGLLLNPKLPVKKILKKLKKDNPAIEVPQPVVFSLEREKAYENENYMLPPTYVKLKNDEVSENIKGIGQAFLEILKTDADKFRDSIKNLNSMSDEDFAKLFNFLCSPLDVSQKITARRSAEIIIYHRSDNVFTIREEIVLNLYYMVEHLGIFNPSHYKN